VERITIPYLAILVAAILFVIIVTSSILIYQIKKIRRNLDNIWHNCQPFQMAQAFEFMGEKEKAIMCYKETLYNVIHRKFRIPKMGKKIQIDYLTSKILSLGGKLPDDW